MHCNNGRHFIEQVAIELTIRDERNSIFIRQFCDTGIKALTTAQLKGQSENIV